MTDFDKVFEVTGQYKKAGAVVFASFGTQAEALLFARETATNCIEAGSDSLVSVTVTNKTTAKALSTFYPEPYEAESLDDDDDG